MTEHTVKSFGEQLEALSALVAQMGGLAEAQFAAAIEAKEKTTQGRDRRNRDDIKSAASHLAAKFQRANPATPDYLFT